MTNNQIKGFALMFIGIMLMLIGIGLWMMGGAVIGLIFGVAGIFVELIGLNGVWPNDDADESNDKQKPTGKE